MASQHQEAETGTLTKNARLQDVDSMLASLITLLSIEIDLLN